MELQSLNLREIASFAADSLSKNHPGIVAVEDSGLFVRTLGGFPGPYSAYVHRTIGPSGLLKLLSGNRERAAFFQASVAAAKSGRTYKVFTGRVTGNIAWREKGKNGFGFDPIFIPQSDKMTFGEMDENRKNILSHRHQAFRKLAEWYLSP
jgi:XTP/dITP diphosphohydrolase